MLGFTSEIRHYMQLSDFFIGKPGPGSISEAVQQGLPGDRGRATPGPCRRSATTPNGSGRTTPDIVLDSFRSVREGVAEIVSRLDEFRASMAHIRNRAVFEIPEILERIMRTEGDRTIFERSSRDGTRGSVQLN